MIHGLRSARALARAMARTGPVWAASALALGYVGVVLALLFKPPGRWRAIDLQVYQAGARAFLRGADIYTAHPAHSHLPFTYPPFAAVFFVPVALLGLVVARVMVTTLSVAALVLALALSVRSARPQWSARGCWTAALLVAAAVLFTDPVYWTLAFGQINLLLMAVVLVDVLALRVPLPRGVLVGLATAVKLTPGIFILYFVLTRRFWAALTAGAVVAGSIAVGFLAAPASSREYWTRLVFEPRRVGGVEFVGNQSLHGAAARLAGGVQAGAAWWAAAVAVALLAGLVCTALAARKGHELLAVALCAVTGLLVSPISWNHHWVWALPVAVVLWARCLDLREPARLAAAGAWTALFYLAPIWWVPNRQSREYTHHGLQLLAGNAYVLAGVLLLAAAPVLSRRHTVAASHPVAGDKDKPPTLSEAMA